MSAPAPGVAVGAADGSGAMFDGIAGRYDLLNALMSFGLHHRWRRRLVAALELQGGGALLDVATGTADVAIDVARAHPDVRVVGLDPSTGMLRLGADKVRAAGVAERVELVTGRAEALPFADGRFAACSVAFGIRNVPDRPTALRELWRVTAPGGRLGVLELTEPGGGLVARLARLHVRLMVPVLGLFAGAYRYLPRSIAAFPTPDAFAEELRAAGFNEVKSRRFCFGAVHLFVGRKP